MNEIELSVVLPAYEEAESLRLILPALKELVGRLTPRSELLVVACDDGLPFHFDLPDVDVRLLLSND